MRYLITAKHTDSEIEQVLFTYRGSDIAGIQVAQRQAAEFGKSLFDFKAYKIEA